MFLLIVSVLVALLAVCVVSLILYARWHYGTLEKMGLPVVKPHFLLGSTHDLYKDISPALMDVKWMKKHGTIFGVYEGRDPQIFAADAEFIRLITVKDAQYFDAKRQLEFNDSMLNEMPDFLPGEKWKVVRGLSTPAFSSSKIKLMNMPFIDATKDFVEDIRANMRKTGNATRLEKYPIDDALNTMLTDLVFRSCFSTKIADRYNRDNPYQKLIRDVMSPPALKLWPTLVAWSFSFPFLLKYLPGTMMDGAAGKVFIKMFQNLMNERRKSGQHHNDVMDLLIEWEDKLDTEEMKKHNITHDTLMCEALIFYWVGQDQMSTILGSMIYFLTKHPEIQEKLYNEISSVFAKHDGSIEHNHLGELQYLSACIYEAARFYPFFYRAERVCTKDWESKEFGLKIPKGMTIQIPIWAANRNPKYFEEPETFKPERFLPENKEKLHPYGLSTWGFGKRNCPGQRFSMECMTLVAAYLLKELKFEKRDDTELKFKPVGPWMFAPHDFVYVNVIDRVAPSA